MSRYEFTFRDIVRMIVGMAIVCALGYVGFQLSVARMQANWGLGPDWQCTNFAGQEDLVCTKRQRAAGNEADTNLN